MILLDYLRVISNPESEAGDEALKNIINVPNRYLGRKFIQELSQFAFKRDNYLYPALRSMPIKLTYLRKNVKEFTGFLDPLIKDAENLQPAELINLLRVALDYDRHITDEDIPSPDDVKIANLNQLQMAAARYNDIKSFLTYTETFQDESVCDNKEGREFNHCSSFKGLRISGRGRCGNGGGYNADEKDRKHGRRKTYMLCCNFKSNVFVISFSLNYLSRSTRTKIQIPVRDPR